MSQYSVAKTLSLTGISLDALLDRLGIYMPERPVFFDYASLTELEDTICTSAARSHSEALRRYHGFLDQHSAQLVNIDRQAALSAAEALSYAEGTRAAIGADPVLASVAMQCKQEYEHAQTNFQEALHRYESGAHSAALRQAQTAHSMYRETLCRAYEQVIHAHRSVVAESILDTLSAMGYHAQKAESPERIACWGQQGSGPTFAIVIHQDAQVAIDMGGFSGDECEAEIQRFLQELRSRGVLLSRQRVFPHLRREGGQLIEAANTDREMHEGLLKADLHIRPTAVAHRSAKPSTPVSPRARRMPWLGIGQKG